LVRQKRAIRTRRKILEAAAKVFDARGYTAASMAEILEQANVTKGGLYFHFASKEALAMAVMDEQRHFCQISASRDSPLQEVIDLTQSVARDLQVNTMLRAATRLVIEHGSFTSPHPSIYLMWIQRLNELLEQARADGELSPRTDIEIVAELIVGAFSGIQLIDQVLYGRDQLSQKITEFWRLILPAITVQDRLTTLVPEGTQHDAPDATR
jgi:AcrR family transcriptional regulator